MVSTPSAVRRLLLVRHGLPDYRFGLAGDELPGPPLAEIGRAQARQTIPILAARSPRALYTSPLTRTIQTANEIARGLGLAYTVDSKLKEWHRTEDLYMVNQRGACWLRRWLSNGEDCAVVVSHGSPILGIMRTALYLPHFGWWEPGDPKRAILATCDRFEVSMASVFELLFEPEFVTARCLFHPAPRIMQLRNGRIVPYFPRPTGPMENRVVRRPNPGPLIGYAAPSSLRS
ncbi:MAG: histidine phosphatase family protein [Planctomycetes bacterium]|nr:histidine phosphatase family protein [Planctomycetota bacterium]